VQLQQPVLLRPRMQRLLEEPAYGLNSVEQKAVLLVFDLDRNMKSHRVAGVTWGGINRCAV
jgi:hypothetical protein